MTSKARSMMGLVVLQQLKACGKLDHSCSRAQLSNWRPSSCCQTTSPMRHCKIDSYKHDSQRQRHDGTYSFATTGGPPV
ncbi:unnamed protein product [Staurois parvus]|uniref:Secreted protein n=1 Tax=Staurois parvus TaxID=386267 RepID=A0ABN9EAZ6_9NEOB|nr:unnamed protein product [Staurois parvus]